MKSNKMALLLPCYFDPKVEFHRSKFWDNHYRFVDDKTDVILLLMNATEEEKLRMKERLGDKIRVFTTKRPYSSFLARYILDQIAVYEGYRVVYTTDDDECLNKDEGIFTAVSSSYLKTDNIDEIAADLENFVYGIRYRKLRTTKDKSLEYREEFDEEGNLIWQTRIHTPANYFSKMATYGKHTFPVPSDRPTSRMQRGFMLVAGQLSKVLTSAEQVLRDRGDYVPCYQLFDDLLFSYISYHGMGMRFKTFWSSKDSEIWGSGFHGGGSSSVITAGDTPNTFMNNNINDTEKLEEFNKVHWQLFNELIEAKSIMDIVEEI